LIFDNMWLTRSRKGLSPDEVRELEDITDQLPAVLAELEWRKSFILDNFERERIIQIHQGEIQRERHSYANPASFQNRANDNLVLRRQMEVTDDDARSIVSVNSVAS
jgi:hypothetical protein